MDIRHASDCAIYNAPALPAGSCDCGVVDHHYDYIPARLQIESWPGPIVVRDEDIAGVDPDFKSLDLSQDQVTRLVVLHGWRVRHLFNPSTYGFLDRVKLALHFLFGKGFD